MSSKPISDVWMERAVDAYYKGDFDSAEIRLIISNHLRPNDEVEKLLKLVRSKKVRHTPLVDFSQFRDRKVDSEECIIIAKLAIERGDFNQARTFLILAEKYCPSYYSKKLLKKIKYLENLRIRQQAKKGFAEKYVEEARAHFDVGNYSKAKKLLKKSLSVFSTIQAQTLLKQVQDALELERRNTENNSSQRNFQNSFFYEVLINLFNYLSCYCLDTCGYTRLDDEDQNTNRNDARNTYFFSGNNIPHSREFFGNNNARNDTGHGSRQNRTEDHARRSYNTFQRSENNRYFTSDNIPGNNTNATRNTSNHQSTNARNDTESARNDTESARNNTRDQRNNTGYAYTSENIPGNNSRNTYNRYSTSYAYTFTRNDENTTGQRNRAEGTRNNTESAQNNTHSQRNTGYAYTSENMPGYFFTSRQNRENTNEQRNNTQGARNNTESARNNTRDQRNNTGYAYTSENIPGNNSRNTNNTRNDENTTGQRNHAEGTRNNTESAQNNTHGQRYTGYAYTSENMPGYHFFTSRQNRENTNEQRNNTQGARNNTSNAQSARNNAQGARNDTQSARNNAQGARNDTQSARNNAQRTRTNSNSSSARSRAQFTKHLLEVQRILNAKNDYDRLGIPRGSSKRDVEKAFRKLSLIIHPDKNKAPGAKEAFMAINDARTRLSKITT